MRVQFKIILGYIGLFIPFNLMAGDFSVSIGAGLDDLNLNSQELLNEGIKEEFDAFSMEINMSYYPIPSLRLEAVMFNGGSLNLFSSFDQVQLSASYISVGPSFIPDKSIEIIPQLGFVDWKFEVDEGRFLNTGSEYGNTFSGDDFFLGFQIGWNKIYIKYRYIDTNFGDVSSVLVGFEIGIAK